MNTNITTWRSQQGAALVVALLILVVVSLLGVSAMKSSVFSAKVATGTQADAMTFEAAETGLAGAYKELNNMSGADLYSSLGGGGLLVRCVTEKNIAKSGACAKGDALDSRGLIVAETSSMLNGYELVEGAEIGTTAGSMIDVDYKVAMLGESSMASFNLDNHHVQEALKRGLKPGSEIE
ncbi:PilX N-terminal domain-containing pilus assembly protein [Alcanivorax sp.]|jgi:Tfp pilus assembly protein PilX|uniref:PilX N-terminal domain-containing pilus assembly protein n=1 Tax=Alcanivorax sp. TaxID=1872427 RepID=UPI0032D91D58